MEGENSIRGVFGLPIYLDRIEGIGTSTLSCELSALLGGSRLCRLGTVPFLYFPKSLPRKGLGAAGRGCRVVSLLVTTTYADHKKLLELSQVGVDILPIYSIMEHMGA